MEVARGTRVWVPFRGRGAEGIVLRRFAEGEAAEGEAAGDHGRMQAGAEGVAVRGVERVVGGPPVVPELIGLGGWRAEYYLGPPGEALRLLVPPGGRAAAAERVALTDEGRRAAAALHGALDPPALD